MNYDTIEFVALATCLTFLTVDSVPIDNGIIGEPTIQCSSDAMSVSFVTQRPFEGRVYAKGFVNQLPCVGYGRGNQAPALSISFSQCGVQRSRQLSPVGVSVYTTIVITFHKTFITKVDRAYRITCFYMEAQKTVTASLEVSELSTGYITNRLAMPNCKYEILKGGITGQVIKYVKVGDMVYHKWSCESQDNVFCMKVHTCTVDDGEGGSPFQVLDSNGCAIDRYVLQNLEYPTDLMAGRESHVFKFADKTALYFNCQIEISVKPNDAEDCRKSRPSCSADNSTSINVNVIRNTVSVDINGSAAAAKRNVRETKATSRNRIVQKLINRSTVGNFDLPRQQLLVLDIEDERNSSTDGEIFQSANSNGENGASAVCFSTPMLALGSTAVIILFILTVGFTVKVAAMNYSNVKLRF